MANKYLDNQPRIIPKKPNTEVMMRARRWLQGAAMLLADASNGDPVVEKLAHEAMILSSVTEVVAYEYVSTS